MNHTEQFNKIMAAATPPKTKKSIMQKLSIQPTDNMNGMQSDLQKCTYSGNIIYLPRPNEVQLLNYSELRQALLKAGAKYKSNTFIFPNDAKPYIDRLMGGESVNIKKEFQFFATPKAVAKEMVASISPKEGDDILEPSAGQGALINELINFDDRQKLNIFYCELMDINLGVLSQIKGITKLGEDFLTTDFKGRKFDRIIANPPFSKNQDIDHVRKMYDLLKDGGRIVTITSCHWLFTAGKKETEFKSWLDSIGATYEEIEAGAFKESGTNIKTLMVIIDK